jgi:hypothetical protein
MSRTVATPSGSRRRLNGNPVVISCVRLGGVGRDNDVRRLLWFYAKRERPMISQASNSFLMRIGTCYFKN